MRLTISALKTAIAGYFTPVSDKWEGQEAEDAMINIVDSVGMSQVTLADGATVTWDLTEGNSAMVTLGGNRTLSITNLSTPCCGVLVVKQDATGSRTLALPAGSRKSSTWALSTAANAEDIIGFIYDGTNCRWIMNKALV